MSDQKEQYRVVREWVGGPAAGVVIDGPIHPVLESNVQKVVGEIVTGEGKKESQEIIDSAKAEAQKIIDDAKATANSILDDAEKDAEKIIAEAKPKK